jgi:hypothetical protein
MNNHNTVIVRKPWGYEYLAYKGDKMSLWLLHINQGERTSLHCHPTKTTGLVLVGGCAEINFISDSKILKSPSKQMIRRGLFHQTCAITDVILLEAETPIDKNDLVRLNDSYGRENSGYEKSDSELPKNEDCIWITEPTDNNIHQYKVGNSVLYVTNARDNVLDEFHDDDLIMVLKGGLIKDIDGRNHEVVVPGDVGFVKVVKRVAKEMDGFKHGSVLMFVKEKFKGD